MDDARSDSAVSSTNFLWTLVRCFVIVALGFLAGRFRLIQGREVKGLDLFTSHFCLSALIFFNLCHINLHGVAWEAIFGILLGKILLFALVMTVMLAVGRPGNLANVGLYCIFVTQVNDFGLAYPLLDSLYRTRRPEYASYMYLVSPLSLVILNPVGFFLMEVEKVRRLSKRSLLDGSKVKLTKAVLKAGWAVTVKVVTHPHVWVSLLGILVNTYWKDCLPILVTDVLKVMGRAFTAPILFLLGHYLAKVFTGRDFKDQFLVAAALATMKTVVLPIFLKVSVELLQKKNIDLPSFAFLYGTVPTAPIVILYASQRTLPTQTVATGIALCTVLSIPLMLVSGKVITLSLPGSISTSLHLTPTLATVGGFNVLACICVIVLLTLTGRLRRFLDGICFCLVVSQLLGSVGVFLWSFSAASYSWHRVLASSLVLVGQFASRLWTALLALAMYLMKHREEQQLIKYTPWMFLCGFGVPIVLLSSHMVTGHLLHVPAAESADVPLFFNGDIEAIAAILVLTLSAVITAFVIIEHICDWVRLPRGSQASPSQVINYPNAVPALKTTKIVHPNARPLNRGASDTAMGTGGIETPPSPLCKKGSSGRVRFQLPPEEPASWPGSSCTTDSKQGKYGVLLVGLFVSIVTGLVACFWKVLAGHSSHQTRGMVMAMEFLDAILSFSQGILAFCIYVADAGLMKAAKQKVFRIVARKDDWKRLKRDEKLLSEEDATTCEQFSKYHYRNFEKMLEDTEIMPASTKGIPFHGHKLVDWLLDSGLSRSRADGVLYGRSLLAGRIIVHEDDELHFYDGPYTYFLPPRTSS